jgi:pyruvate-formate lyase-activating enzyme
MLNEVFENSRNKLNMVGCGFCLAKWTQVTMHLHNGTTHSCHHPKPHKIPLEEILSNPTALHNTKFKKEIRKEMLEDKKPDECDYCWNIENSSYAFSDRTLKSSEPWSAPYLEDILKSGWKKNYNPKYVEVSFSNTCNFKCSYCGPQYSSKWMEEINTHGPYKTSTNYNDIEWFKKEDTMPYLASENNPYVDAFWKWWPEMYQDLHTFRITGGEPLLNKDTFKILDYIIETPTPNKKLSLCINSNLGIPKKLFDEFVLKIEKILDKELVHEFIIFTSCDTWGAQAEYIRNGFDYNLFKERIDFLLDKFKPLTIDIMSTYNALSVPNYKYLIEDVVELKKRHHNPYRYWGSSLLLDSSYLRFPEHQSVKILEDTWVSAIDEQAKLVDFYEQVRTGVVDGHGFTDIEINKIIRIKDWFTSSEGNKMIDTNRKDFHTFITQHDNRRNTDFCKTFPELEEFYHKCGKI